MKGIPILPKNTFQNEQQVLRWGAGWRDAFVLETNDLPLLRDADTIHVFLLRGLHLAHNLIAVARFPAISELLTVN